MYMHQSTLILLPTLLSYISTVVNGEPTLNNATDLMLELQLEKREVVPWIETFADVGCHVPVGTYTRLDNMEGCVNWNSDQPGLYFGINWGQGMSALNQIELFTEPGCVGTGGAPLYAGSKGEKAGNYVQKAPKDMYEKGKVPMGQCFDGVFRHWPVASDGSPFKSFHASNGPMY